MGDTVWTPEVIRTLYLYNPEVVVMNTGFAKALNYDDGIIMGTEDVGKACQVMPNSKIITVHMDAINHCTIDRKNMRNYVNQNHLEKQVAVPDDGETLKL